MRDPGALRANSSSINLKFPPPVVFHCRLRGSLNDRTDRNLEGRTIWNSTSTSQAQYRAQTWRRSPPSRDWRCAGRHACRGFCLRLMDLKPVHGTSGPTRFLQLQLLPQRRIGNEARACHSDPAKAVMLFAKAKCGTVGSTLTFLETKRDGAPLCHSARFTP